MSLAETTERPNILPSQDLIDGLERALHTHQQQQVAEPTAVGKMAAAAVRKASEQIAEQIRISLSNARLEMAKLERSAEALIEQTLQQSRNFEADIEAFTALAQNVSLTINQAENTIATFGANR